MGWGLPKLPHEPSFITKVKHEVHHAEERIEKQVKKEVKAVTKSASKHEKAVHDSFANTKAVVNTEFHKLPRRVKRESHHLQARLQQGLRKGTQARATLNQELHNGIADIQAKYNLATEEAEKIRTYVDKNITGALNTVMANAPKFPPDPPEFSLFGDIDPKIVLAGLAGVGALILI